MIRIGINGFGRIGRLVFRAAFERPDVAVVQINDPAGDPTGAANLVNHDSIQGAWTHHATADTEALQVGDEVIRWRQSREVASADWNGAGVDLVVDCSGQFKSEDKLQSYLDAGIGHVVVSAPVADESVPNIVVGVNDDAFDPARDRLVSGASCTTNCVAPVVKVLHETLGVLRGSINTIHAMTATQSVLDGFHKDPRRARAASSSLIPTTTGSAKAIGRIFPELDGHLSGLAVRVPVTCPSLTDCTFELDHAADRAVVNDALRQAADGSLHGILGVSDEPLVSVDYIGDPRSSIVDALSTLVVDRHHAKILAWYDNERGYSERLLDLVERIARDR